MTYEYKKAGRYWSKRLKSVKRFNAVLTYSATDEENESHHNWELETIIANIHDDTMGLEFLDIGCGWGRLATPLSGHLKAVFTGIDASTEMIKKYPYAGIVGDVTNFDLGRKFDVVLCMGVLEHIPTELRKNVLENIYKHLGGIAFILVNSDDIQSAPVQEDGYYCSPVYVKEIREFSNQVGLETEIVSSNKNFHIVKIKR